VGLVRAALFPDPSKPPTDLSILDDNRLYPLASILCERSQAVGFGSLDALIGVLNIPRLPSPATIHATSSCRT